MEFGNSAKEVKGEVGTLRLIGMGILIPLESFTYPVILNF